MWIEEYLYHISHYKQENLLKMELNALERIKTNDSKYSKEIQEKIKVVKNRLNEILKKTKLIVFFILSYIIKL